MLSDVSTRLRSVLETLSKRGRLSKTDVNTALNDVKTILLEADVAVPVVRDLINRLQTKAQGTEITQSVNPAQQMVKLVFDQLVQVLQTTATTATASDKHSVLALSPPPTVIVMVGLQGSGKTTTTGKLGYWLHKQSNKRVLLAATDTRRPAGQEQLAILAKRASVDCVDVVSGESALSMAVRGYELAQKKGYDVYIVDTAGRLHTDADLLHEIKSIRDALTPQHVIFVADGLSGQDAVTAATQFNDVVDLTGFILTRLDGDGRGGAVLSLPWMLKKPIHFLGNGEHLDALEQFDADRIARRILGMGDIISFVEKAQAMQAEEQQKRTIARLSRGKFTLADLRSQLQQMANMGGISQIMSALPKMGMGAMAMVKNPEQHAASVGFDDKGVKHNIALINAMTKLERNNPHILQASRKRRIAKGAGLTVNDVNRLLKMHQKMAGAVKKMTKGKSASMFKNLLQAEANNPMATETTGVPNLDLSLPENSDVNALTRKLSQAMQSKP